MAYRLARWWLLVLGSMFLGGGLVLYSQVECALLIREEVSNTFFLWRGIGHLTFMFHDNMTQFSLWLDTMPPNTIEESRRSAIAFLTIGGVLFGLSLVVRAVTPRAKAKASRPGKKLSSRS